MTPVPDRVPVLIAGGGPSGLAAAIELGRRGIEVLVVEPRTVLDPLRPRAKTTSVRTMEHLRRWGIADRLRAAAPLPVEHAQDVVFVTGLFGHEITRFENAFGLWTTPQEIAAEPGQQAPQPLVEEVLREAAAELPSVTLLIGWRVASVLDGPDEAQAVARGTRTASRTAITADYLLGCDGSSGISRTAIGARYEGSSGTLPNLSITFRSRALEERELCALGVHYWVIGAERGGLMGRLDLDGTWWAIVQGVDARVRGRRPGRARAVAGRRRHRRRGAGHRPVVGADAAGRPLPRRAGLPRRRRRPPEPAVGRARLQHLRRRRGQPRLEAGRRPAGLGTAVAARQLRGRAPSGGPADDRRGRRPGGVPRAVLRRGRPRRRRDGRAGCCAATSPGAWRSRTREFHSLGLVLGYDYPDSPVVVPDGRPVPAPTARHLRAVGPPGRAPAARLAARRARRSTTCSATASRCCGSAPDVDADRVHRRGDPAADPAPGARSRPPAPAAVALRGRPGPRPPRPARRLARTRRPRTPTACSATSSAPPTARTSSRPPRPPRGDLPMTAPHPSPTGRLPLGRRHRRPPGRGRQRQQRPLGDGARRALAVRRAQRRRLRLLPPLARGPRPRGRRRPEHLPVQPRVEPDRAGGGRVLPRRPRPLPADRRRLPRAGPEPARHARPLHDAALADARRRLDRPEGRRPPRPLRRVRRPGADRRRVRRDDQRAQPDGRPAGAGRHGQARRADPRPAPPRPGRRRRAARTARPGPRGASAAPACARA